MPVHTVGGRGEEFFQLHIGTYIYKSCYGSAFSWIRIHLLSSHTGSRSGSGSVLGLAQMSDLNYICLASKCFSEMIIKTHYTQDQIAPLALVTKATEFSLSKPDLSLFIIGFLSAVHEVQCWLLQKSDSRKSAQIILRKQQRYLYIVLRRRISRNSLPDR